MRSLLTQHLSLVKEGHEPAANDFVEKLGLDPTGLNIKLVHVLLMPGTQVEKSGALHRNSDDFFGRVFQQSALDAG